MRRARLAYRRRRDRLVGRAGRARAGGRVTGIAAGLHALVELPPGRSEADVVAARRAAAGWRLDAARRLPHRGATHPPALVVGYGTPPEHAFTTAVDLLCAVLG